VILDRASDIIPDNTSGLRTALNHKQIPCYAKGNDSSLYFKHLTILSIIIISARGSIIGKEITLILVVIQAIAIQKRNIIVKALDFYYNNRSKLDSFFMSIDIYILFN
jgi:hypothetical protein